MTADEVVVVTHDLQLNPDITRTADGEWRVLQGPPIGSLRLAELTGFDVGRIRPGSAYAAEYPDQVSRDGERIPPLADVLRLDVSVRFNIELKSFPDRSGLTVDGARMADCAVAVADAAGAASRLIVQSFDWRGPRHLRRTRSDIRLSWLTRSNLFDDVNTWWDGPHPADYAGSVPRAVAAEGGPVWGPDHHDLTRDTIAEAHALGLQVVPWTVNDPADMRRLIDWGIDGLITDRVDLARVVFAELGISLPPSRRPKEVGAC
jgi:glycerophosphoryl diester phosphodiesterase